MTGAPGSGFVGSTKGLQRFFRRWGAKANIRSVANFVLPVAVVDTYRGAESGSFRAITGATLGRTAEHPALILVALPDEDGKNRVEIEIHQMAIWQSTGNDLGPMPAGTRDVHLFSPVAPYNPVLNLNPVGFFVPGLNLDPAFTIGRTVMFAGSNPDLPIDIGFQLSHWFGINPIPFNRPVAFELQGSSDDNRPTRRMNFDPPLLLPADQGISLAVQWITDKPGFPAAAVLRWTVLYTERFLSD